MLGRLPAHAKLLIGQALPDRSEETGFKRSTQHPTAQEFTFRREQKSITIRRQAMPTLKKRRGFFSKPSYRMLSIIA